MNKERILARIDAYEKLMRLHRPIGILLLLWPTFWALWLAQRGVPNPMAILLFFTGTVLMRSGGCALNDFADRRFDGQVERTKDRPLATGVIQPWEALVVAAVCALLAFVVVVRMNSLTVQLSFAALAIAIIYPFLKRFFWMPQAWLGIAFGFGIPMAFAALKAAVPPVAWVLLAANIFWTIAYDTEYAMVDRDDDVRLGMKTSAILFGKYDVIAVMACHGAFIAILAGIGLWQAYGPWYYAGVAAAALLAATHYPMIRTRTREGCFKAFLHNNWIGFAVFAGIVADNHPWLTGQRWIPSWLS
ncbi:MAG TPA: 4-hydroxybenzoate octaprenyltransferase [Usitatibacter sp.]|jgi:4-hydroxybenzoate polyprenyltransferase